jgi:hypothetical protein
MVEEIHLLTYTRVAAGTSPAEATSRAHDDALDAFFRGHVEALRNYAGSQSSCPATFNEIQGRTLFETLRSGTDAEFLDAAGSLTKRLIGVMDGRTRPGLLVCLQLRDGDAQSAAVLKLQVVTKHAATLQDVDEGKERLSAVLNVMDAPGKLQKGALVNDSRPGSEVVMGDVASREAQYFPRAFGISIEQRADRSAVDTLDAIREIHGEVVQQAARIAMPSVSSGSLTNVLDQLSQAVPALADARTRHGIEERLASRPRPVRNVDTSAPLTEVVRAADVTVRAPATGEDRITWERDTNLGGWIIQVRVDEEPRRTLQ